MPFSKVRQETSRHDMVRFSKAKNRLGYRSGFSFRSASNALRLPCRHTLSRALPTPGASPQPAMPVCSGRLQWRLSADANLRHKGVGSPTQYRLRATTNYPYCSAADSVNHAVGPTVFLASAQRNPAAPLALRAPTAPRHYRMSATNCAHTALTVRRLEPTAVVTWRNRATPGDTTHSASP